MLICKSCAREFEFTANEQQFYAEKGFQHEPQRCRECRQARRAGEGAHGAVTGTTQRQNFEAVCADCGVSTTVPFRPRGDRPVYCRACFTAHAPAPAHV